MPAGDTSQLVVDQRNQRVAGCFITVTPGPQHLRQVLRNGYSHGDLLKPGSRGENSSASSKVRAGSRRELAAQVPVADFNRVPVMVNHDLAGIVSEVRESAQ